MASLILVEFGTGAHRRMLQGSLHTVSTETSAKRYGYTQHLLVTGSVSSYLLLQNRYQNLNDVDLGSDVFILPIFSSYSHTMKARTVCNMSTLHESPAQSKVQSQCLAKDETACGLSE